jgi:dTDP-4-amino-4,6-dideoxygalactose transaminase
MPSLPLIDMAAQYRSIQKEIDDAVSQVLSAGQFILGPNVTALEKEIAEYLSVAHAVGVASGTDALVLALRALGIGPGDEVIVPSYTFFATAGAVLLVGATPICVDVHADTYTMDVEQIGSRITLRTKAIIPVHLYGHPANLNPLIELARMRGLKVIEDNAQAFGAEYHGRKTGGFGDVACLSFFPSKNLGGCGDGGMVVTGDSDIADRVRMLRTHGWRKKYFPEMVGYNSRLDELQAAILRVKLRHVDDWNNKRRSLAAQYTLRFAGSGIKVPTETKETVHAYHLYVVEVDERERVQQQLKQMGIPTAIYYPQPLHLTLPLADRYSKGQFPVSESASERTLSLPFFPEMSDEQLNMVVDRVRASVNSLQQIRSN